MIKKVKLHNFKKYKDNTFELNDKGVSLLVGGNNSGKSTLIHALAIWEFCKMILNYEQGQDSFWFKSFKKRQGFGMSAEEFLPVAVPSFAHLWTNLKTIQSNEEKHDFPGYSLRIACMWDSEHVKDCKLEFGLSLVNDRLFIRTTDTNLDDNSFIPSIVYMPTFAGVLPKENKVAISERRSKLGQGMAGSVIRNMVYDLYNQDQEMRNQLKGDKSKLSKNDYVELREKSPFEKLQNVLRNVFKTELVVQPFNPEYQTVLRIDERKGDFDDHGKFKPYIKSKYSPRDIMVQGSGFLQWLSIFCVLLSPSIDTLVLDEPDAHLHAILQKEMLERLINFVDTEKKQILISTHSVEMIKNADLSKILSIDKRKYLTDEISRVSLLNGIGTEYSPQLNRLQKIKKVLFVENASDYIILEKIGKIIRKGFPSDIVVWQTTDSHANRLKLFIELKKHIPGLKGISLRDCDLESIDIVGEGLKYKGVKNSDNDILLLQWRRRNIESYFLCPKAIAIHSNREVSEIIDFFAKEYAIVIEADGYKEASPPDIVLECDGKKLFTDPFKGIHSVYSCDKYNVIENLSKEEICEDLVVFIERAIKHFSI